MNRVVKPFQTTPIQLRKYQAPVYCCICSKAATTNALFQLEDCAVIQKYCDECLPNADYQIP